MIHIGKHETMMTHDFEELKQKIDRLIAPAKGVIGCCVRDLATGEEIGARQDEMFPMASVCKVPILATAYRLVDAGKLDLTERVELTDARRCFGSGLLNFFDGGLNPSLRDLLHLMIIVSDNAATDIILERVGGPAAVTAAMRELGIDAIRVDRTIRELLGAYFTALEPKLEGICYGEWEEREAAIPGLKERNKDLEVIYASVIAATTGCDLASPRAMARLCGMIARNECAGAESCEQMLEIMRRQQLNGRLPRHLPPFWQFPHKTGTLGTGVVVNDAGVLYHSEAPVAAVAVFCREMQDPIYETETRLAELGRAVWDHYASV